METISERIEQLTKKPQIGNAPISGHEINTDKMSLETFLKASGNKPELIELALHRTEIALRRKIFEADLVQLHIMAYQTELLEGILNTLKQVTGKKG